MSYAYPLTFPTTTSIRKQTVRLHRQQAYSISPFTGKMQTVAHTGAWWEFDLELPPCSETEANTWLAFFMKLWGLTGTFYFSDPDGNVRGTPLGSPVVAAGGFNADMCSVASTGWTATKTGLLLPGDWISFSNYEYKRVTTQVDSDGSGNATIYFEPMMRVAVGAGTVIATSAAKGIFKLTSPVLTYNSDEAQVFGFAFGIRESIA